MTNQAKFQLLMKHLENYVEARRRKIKMASKSELHMGRYLEIMDLGVYLNRLFKEEK